MIDQLAEFLESHPGLMVITGAGMSTASGIGDYRDERGDWKREPPVQLAEFLGSAHWRRRYWARSMFGWPAFARARPNPAHAALAALEADGRVGFTLTQNVDDLHLIAGQQRLLALHGRLSRVRCLGCGALSERAEVQQRLEADNPAFSAQVVAMAPDGDADLDVDDLEEALAAFQVPTCLVCNGTLKPDVVFYGESVPLKRVDAGYRELDAASALLVLGSSVMVFSSFRFCRAAAEAGKPIAIINRGRTRADELAAVKLAGDCAEVLSVLAG
jgi:NAD-dependent SIR2 family protein deacetylase